MGCSQRIERAQAHDSAFSGLLETQNTAVRWAKQRVPISLDYGDSIAPSIACYQTSPAIATPNPQKTLNNKVHIFHKDS
jgi:hypothetical protein